MSKEKENLSYDKALKELKMIVGQLQEEAVSVDDLSSKAKRAAELIKYCREQLRRTEGDLKSLFEE
jgi:exodeoxyribonuclease VII small subunit